MNTRASVEPLPAGVPARLHVAWRTAAILAATLAIEVVLLLNVIDPAYVSTADEEAVWMWIGGLMAFPVAAALVLVHRPSNRVGWALGVVAVSAGLIGLLSWYAVRYPDAPLSAEAEAIERVAAVGQFAGIVALMYLFPDGKPASTWHRWSFLLFLWVMGGGAILWLFSPTDLVLTGRENPLGILPEAVGRTAEASFVLLLPFALNGIAALVIRWRRGDGVTRAQMKYFLAGAIAGLAILVLANIVPEDPGARIANQIGSVVVLLGFWALPAAIVVAILRHRLYDIDRVLNRTLVYAMLTASLALLYLGLVVGLQALFRPVSGGSDLSIALTTLIVAALFMPARRRVQALVDRRFNRRAYDAARTLDAFGARLRQHTDLDTLRYELLAVVDETMEPERVSLWLRPGAKRTS